MLYKKNTQKTLDDSLFKNPTSEYRGTPFWAWNCELNEDILTRQIEYLKEMGFGGFHMHPRAGMATEYLSDDFFKLVSSCIEKAKKENMLAYLYDEDRYPSGFAGGYVTKDPRFRKRFIEFTPEKKENCVSAEEAYTSGQPTLLACYNITLSEDGYMKDYKRDEEGSNTWYAYLITDTPTGRYNNQTYVDTLNPDAIDKFIEVTHEKYKEKFKDEFGKTIPSIFTDEPQFAAVRIHTSSTEKNAAQIPWTHNLDKSFKEKYNFDILDFLPEIFWEKGKNEVSSARYYFYDFLSERLAEAFTDRIGKWCEENGIEFTGHTLYEETLTSQSLFVGESMRGYRSFGIPGIDMLCNGIQFSTAKQAQSSVHQYGREGMMSELYGVTNWDFDFRGHKFQGDWQAALGVTIRVPHLSWVSMKGAAKRDYPASISYQSPWYKKYSFIEDHFARLNTALTRGKPVVDVAVIHPIESFWISNGPEDKTSGIKTELEENFDGIISNLLFGQIDFDFISEALLPSQYRPGGNTLTVGEMNYKTIVVPPLRTIRKTTLEILNQFISNGGKVIFMNKAPEFVDALRSNEAEKLYEKGIRIDNSKTQLLEALENERRVSISDLTYGCACDDFIYALRQDSDCEWLFIARAKPLNINRIYENTLLKDLKHTQKFVNTNKCFCQHTVIKVTGEFTPVLYDTQTGEIKEIPFETVNGNTEIFNSFHEHDSLLIKLLPKTKSSYNVTPVQKKLIKTIEQQGYVTYTREESNLYLLDMAKYSLDGGELRDTEEILRADTAVREELGLVMANGRDVQPWLIKEGAPEHFVTLQFEIQSNTEIKDTYLAFEEAEEVNLNGKNIDINICGYYVDESIRKIPLGDMIKGLNILKVKVPVTDRLSLENMFLLGEFNVSLNGYVKTLEEKTNKMTFSSLPSQGMPFYGGNVVYETEIETPECDIEVDVSLYKGALVGISIDDSEEVITAFAPYTASFENITAGKHKISYRLYGNRYNTFGPLHNCTKGGCWWGSPESWYTDDINWAYEYTLESTGILKSPVIRMYEK